MKTLDIYYAHSLVNEIFDLNTNQIPHKNLISPRNWKDKLTHHEIKQINETWSKFVYSESFLSESVVSNTSRIDRWEQFIKLEDSRGNYDLTNEGIWDKVKSGLKWVSRKVAGKRSLEKGGSLFGLGAKSKAQRAEWDKLQQDQKQLIDIVKAATSEDYPNNEDVEEFKAQTAKALSDAEAFIKTHEDSAVRAEMYKALKKWISYLLDQKIGDHYKHFMENMSLAGALLILEAEEEKKEEEALGTKKGSSESIKGLNSKVLPTVLKVLGGAGLAIAGGILAANPEIFSSTAKAIVSDDVQTITKEVDKVVPPITVTERFADKFTPEFFSKLQVNGVQIVGDPGHNSKDFLSFVAKNYGNGDEAKGLTGYFNAVNMDTDKGRNVSYILKRMNSGMNVQDAFKMPGSAGGVMERFGGAAGKPISIGGMVAKQLTTSVVKTTVTKMVGAGVLGAAGAATAAGVAAGVGLGGILSGFAISRLREKSKKDSRAAFLDDLLDKIGEVEQKEEETGPTPTPTPVPPPEPPPEEDDDGRKEKEDEEGGGPGPGPSPAPEPEEGETEKKSGKPVKKMTTVNASGSYLSGVANKFLDSIGVKDQDKRYASQPAVAALDTLMKKKALLADSRIRLQKLLETASDIDITAKRAEKDSYKGNPKDHPLFNDVVASIKSQEKLLHSGTTPEKFAEDFMQYLINNDNIALPDATEEKKIDTKKIVDAASKFVKDDEKAQAEIPGMIDSLKQAGKLNDSLSSSYGKDVSGMNLIDFTKGKSWAPKSISQRAAAVALFKAGAINESTLRTVLREISENSDSKLIAENNRWMKLAGLIK